MNNNYIPTNIPGAFPGSSIDAAPQTMSPKSINQSATILDQDNYVKFRNKQTINQKTKHQQHIISQLETLVYLLVGYQFIKYCHSACLVPVILHILVQKFLSCESITSSNSSNGFIGVIDFITRRIENNEGQPSRDQLIHVMITKTCLAIYWKFIFACLYHILFICLWATSIADSGNIKRLENGTWWFISFIGEETPHEINSSTNYWVKLNKLGLPGLLITDFLILFVQLILYQSIFKQSTLLHKERRLNDDETYILRAPGDSSSNVDGSTLMINDIPVVLKVKLFESFKSESFIADP